MIYKNAKALGTFLLMVVALFPLAAQPILICPPNLTVNIEPGLDSTVLDYDIPPVPTLCPGGQATVTVVVGPQPGGTFDLGPNLICLAATDTCGGASSCCFTVTVQASTQLAITCPADLTVNADAGGTTAIVDYDAPDADSTCASGVVVSLIAGPASGDTFPAGLTQVCYAAVDTCNGVSVCCFTVTVDTAAGPPLTLTCPANITVNTTGGATTAVVNYNAPVDNTTCPGGAAVTLLSGPASGATFQLGDTQICYQSTDSCTGTETCCFTVTVQATQPPTITCAGNQFVTALPGATTSLVNFQAATATSTCPGGVTVTQVSGPASGTAFPLGATQVCYTATDACGATASCCFTVTVLDAPTLNCPGDSTVMVMMGMNTVTFNFNQPAFDSDCPIGIDSVFQTSGLASGSMFPLGANQVCYTATDDCGGTATCCFTVTVNSMGLPTDPCDTKTVGCVKFEILDPVTKDHNGDYHYRIRFTNNCAGRTLTYVALQVPDGTISPGPLSGNYTAPSGRTYWVRNPNHNPFYSVRFKANNPDALGAGQSEIFEYIIDQQGQGMTTGGPNGEPGPGIENMFIHAFARMSNGVGYEVHLNTFDCHLGNLDLVAPERPSEAISAEPVDDGSEEFVYFPANVSNELAIYPNPTRGELFIDLSEFKGQDVQLYVLNARGQRVQAELLKATDQAQTLQLVNGLSDGLYYLEIEGAPGAKQVLRFVLQR